MPELRTQFGSQRFGSVSFTKVSQDTIIREKAWNVSILISKRHTEILFQRSLLQMLVFPLGHDLDPCCLLRTVGSMSRHLVLVPPPPLVKRITIRLGSNSTSTNEGGAHQLTWRSLSDLHVHLWIFTDDLISLAFHFPPKFPFHVSLQRVVHLSPETCTLSHFQTYVEQVGNPCRAGYESDDCSSPQRTPENMSPILATSKWQLRREEMITLDGATRMRVDDGRLEDKSDDETRHCDRPARTGCREMPRLRPSLGRSPGAFILLGKTPTYTFCPGLVKVKWRAWAGTLTALRHGYC